MNRLFTNPQTSSAVARQAGQLITKRNGSTGGHDGNVVGMKNFAVIGAGVIVAIGAFIFATDKHGHRCEVKYPYLAIRSKPFPWGDGDTSLFEQGQKGGKHH